MPRGVRSPKGSAVDRRISAAELLLLGTTNIDVARRLDLHISTIQRWVADPEFQAMMDAMKARVHQSRADRLCTVFEKAIRRIEKDIESDEKNGGVIALKLIEILGYGALANRSIETTVGSQSQGNQQQQNEEERIVGVPRLERLDREMRLLAAERDRVAGLVVVEQAPKQQVDEVA